MPRIADRNLHGVAFQYRTPDEAQDRIRLGGSSFLVGREIGRSVELTGQRQYVPYLVSNKHIVFDDSACVASVNRLDGSGPTTWDIDQLDWQPHPNNADIVVACVDEHLDRPVHRITFIPEYRFVTPSFLDRMDVGIGDEVFMIGRFLNHQGKKENRPAVRFGSISAMLDEFSGQKRDKTLWKEEGFAVEMRSRTGFSGSPVAVYRTAATVITEVPAGAEDFWALLGINFGYVFDDERQNTWLNGVVPAWKISETLNVPKLMERQAESEKRFYDGLVPLDTGGFGFAASTDLGGWIKDEPKE